MENYINGGNVNLFLRIATLNLCLGLKFKKDRVQNILNENKIDILMMQETELENDFNCELLNIPGFKFGYEKTLEKAESEHSFVTQ